MHVIESQEDLFCDLLDEMGRDAFALVALDEPEQVLAEDLEDHTDMRTIWSTMTKVVEEADDVGPARVCWVGGDDALEELNFVQGCLGVPGSGLDDLEGNVAVRSGMGPSDKLHAIERHVHALYVLCQPDRREVAPAELADDEVAGVGKGVIDVYGVVPALDVVLPVLLVLGHDRMRRVRG